MFARLSADTGLIRRYGANCSDQAVDLDSAVARLNALGAGPPPLFGPVGARFVAALRRAAEREAGAVTRLSTSLATGSVAARGSAGAYDRTDDEAAARITGI